MGSPLERKDNIVFVRLPALLDLIAVEAFVKQVMAEFAGHAPAAFVFDLSACRSVDPSFFTQVTVVNEHLSRHAIRLYVVAPTSAHETVLRSHGIDNIATLIKSDAELTEREDAKLPKFIDNEVLDPFVSGTVHTLRVQFNLESHAGAPFVKGRKPDIDGQIAATTGLISNLLNGSLTVVFPETVFLTMMGNMLGTKYTAITDDIEDGAAEFLNIIFGWARNVLNGQGFGFESTIPTVVRGHHVHSGHNAHVSTVVIPFGTPVGSFQLEISSKD